MAECRMSGLETGSKNKTVHPEVKRLLDVYGTWMSEAMTRTGKANLGESFDDWKKRVAVIYKKIMAELKPYERQPEPEPRGYYTGKDGRKYREYIGFGGRMVNELVLEDCDQYKG